MALTKAQKENAERNRRYWEQREAEALKHRITDEKEFDKELHKIYANMLDNIQNEINAFYGRYASKEGISIAEAKKRVSALDIKAYERKAKRYVKEKDFSAEANEEMRLYNLTMKVNRLELLKANIGLEMIAGHDEIKKFMEGILQGRTEDELKRQAGILGKSVTNNGKAARVIVNGSFHNATFSDRIWQYHDLMKADLSKVLQTGLIQGKNPRAIGKELYKYWYGNDPRTGGGAQYCMERLMRTELARVQTEAQKESFIRNGFSMYTFHTNSGCCDICAALNGKHFKIEKMMPGVNASPMHPHCRCSASAYEDTEEYNEWLDYVSKGGSTAEWNKMRAKSTKNKTVSSGLAAKISGNGVPEHEEPKFVKNINYGDESLTMQEMNAFEKEAVKKKIETACVITKDGEVFHCYGVKDGVFPDTDLKGKLRGAKITHNHPIDVTEYTFSSADLMLFQECELSVLRGCDELYTYELTRDKTQIDEFDEDWMNEENFRHNMTIDLAKQYGIGYRRWKNE